MCLFSPNSKKKLKATFTTPRSATGFVVRSASPPLPQRRESEMLYQQSQGQTHQTNQVQQQYMSTQYRTRRPSAWTDPDRGVREWKADIERLERDARIADERAGSARSTLGENADSIVLS